MSLDVVSDGAEPPIPILPNRGLIVPHLSVPATPLVGRGEELERLLALLVEGALDHDIAARLFITRGTAGKHVPRSC